MKSNLVVKKEIIMLWENRNDNNLESEIRPKSDLLKKNEKNYEKRVTFEKYVVNLFDRHDFILYDCSRDNFKTL